MESMLLTLATHDLLSIGCLAATIQQSVRSIERAAATLGIEPVLRLNNIPHFDAEQVEAIRAQLQKSKNQ
jgi:hypothetical protein